jgi:hypothetical protein
MLRVYNNLFCLVYSVLKSLEGGFANQTDSTRAFESAFVISFLETFNVLSVFPDNLGKGYTILVFVGFSVLNLMVFYNQRRYKIIVKDEANKKSHLYYLSAVYVVVSVALFVYTN